MSRLIPGTALRLRRGRRHDLPRLDAALGVSVDARSARRLVAHLGADVYVAEDRDGEIVGLVSIVYARSLMRGGFSAVLDGLRTRERPAGALLEGLVAFAEERARRRGCRRLAAWVGSGDEELRAALLARGYAAGELLVTELRAGGVA